MSDERKSTSRRKLIGDETLIVTETRGKLATALRYEVSHFAVALAPHPHRSDETCIWFDVELVDVNDETARIALAIPQLDPYIVAAEIEAIADAIVQREAISLGLDEQERQEAVREQRRVSRIARAELARQIHTSGGTACEYCGRKVAVIVDGVRLCKRHARELDEMPHGKIGGES